VADQVQALATAGANMVVAVARWIADAVSKLGIFAPVAIPAGVAALYGAYQGARSLFGFRVGGYTGDGDPDEEAGVVHRGEVVLESGIVGGQVQDVLRLRSLLQSGMSARDLVSLAEVIGAPPEAGVEAFGVPVAVASPPPAQSARSVPDTPERQRPVDLTPLLEEMRATRRQLGRALDEIERVKQHPAPVLIGSSEALGLRSVAVQADGDREVPWPGKTRIRRR
jgi:hypothetical protein